MVASAHRAATCGRLCPPRGHLRLAPRTERLPAVGEAYPAVRLSRNARRLLRFHLAPRQAIEASPHRAGLLLLSDEFGGGLSRLRRRSDHNGFGRPDSI
jgi:hypothetical protein